jgi:hypothetical protein
MEADKDRQATSAKIDGDIDLKPIAGYAYRSG